jgi:uncharacterized protein YndB with AHSA1/START domain
MSEQTAPMALRKTITVRRSPDQVFVLFTEGIARWWPVASHSVSGDADAVVVLEPGVGGRIYERTADGAEHRWGTVTVWEQPRRLVFSWHPGRDEAGAQEVELRFLADADRTRVELEHRGWERLGEEAAAMLESYRTGWELVLGQRFAAAADA